MVDHAFSQSNFLPFCPLTSWALPKTRLWGAGILNLVLLLASEVSQDMASAWNDVIGAFIFRMVQDWLRGEQRRHCSLEAAEGWASYHRQYFGEIDYSTGFAGSRTVHNLDCKWVLSIDSSLVGNDSWDSSKDSFCLECSETLRSPMTCSLILRSSFEDCLARAFRTNWENHFFFDCWLEFAAKFLTLHPRVMPLEVPVNLLRYPLIVYFTQNCVAEWVSLTALRSR